MNIKIHAASRITYVAAKKLGKIARDFALGELSKQRFFVLDSSTSFGG